MTTDLLHRIHHDTAWNGLAALTLATVALALIVLAYTAGSRHR